MTAHDDAVKAAAEAILDRYGWGDGNVTERMHLDAEAAVAAAAPILLAAERTRIEQLFEQRYYPGRVWTLMDLRAVVHHPAPAETAPEPCRCAGHYLACDTSCPDFWLPDVPMSPIKGHAETAPEEES